MSKDLLARRLYAVAVGGLCGALIPSLVTALLVGMGIILAVGVIAEVFGEEA